MNDKIKCLECGKECGSITTQHLKTCCGMTLEQYKQKYPNIETTSEKLKQIRIINCIKLKQKTKKLFCSGGCGNSIEVKAQRSSYVCDNCKEKGIESSASKNGKIGAEKIQGIYHNDPLRKESMGKKVSKTLKKHFEDPLKKEKTINKRKKTTFEKTGYQHYMHNPENVKHIFDLRNEETIQQTRENTNLKLYGVKTLLEDPKFREKISKENFKITGYYHWTQSPQGKQILRNLGLKRHDKNRNEILENLEIVLDDKEYIHAHYDHIWICKKCNNKFKTCWNNIQQGYLCPTCFPRTGGSSIAETEIFMFLQSILPNELILKNDKKTIYPYELDIIIPNLNFAIEHNGLLWHSNTLEHQRIDRYYHITKTNLCKQKNINLLHIFEDEWLYKKDLVKKRIEHILNKNNSQRIHARKCEIKFVDSISKDIFLNQYHIQGADISLIRLGAFFNDELVSIMTFSHGNISKGSKKREGVWELNRFCINYNYTIPGIAGKLLNYFMTNFEWKKIYSYADLRWSDGGLYYKLGFKLEYCTQPNYWYIKGYKRIHRYSLRKTKNEPKNISEKLLRLNEGYRILYDCGNLKFSIEK